MLLCLVDNHGLDSLDIVLSLALLMRLLGDRLPIVDDRAQRVSIVALMAGLLGTVSTLASKLHPALLGHCLRLEVYPFHSHDLACLVLGTDQRTALLTERWLLSDRIEAFFVRFPAARLVGLVSFVCFTWCGRIFPIRHIDILFLFRDDFLRWHVVLVVLLLLPLLRLVVMLVVGLVLLLGRLLPFLHERLWVRFQR